MAQVIKTTFKFRRNLASYWAEKNPVLAEGEPCFELDTGKLKIGNGTTAYNDLPSRVLRLLPLMLLRLPRARPLLMRRARLTHSMLRILLLIRNL